MNFCITKGIQCPFANAHGYCCQAVCTNYQIKYDSKTYPTEVHNGDYPEYISVSMCDGSKRLYKRVGD